MKSPSLPNNEAKRLSALRESGLLEPEDHPTYARITRLARRVFGVPVAMINLVDEHVVVVKSTDGGDPTSLPRNLSFCGHTVLSDAPLVIPDTLDDTRFADNPWSPTMILSAFTRVIRCVCPVGPRWDRSALSITIHALFRLLTLRRWPTWRHWWKRSLPPPAPVSPTR